MTWILNPQHKDWLAIVKGFRNGLVYGAKVRFPHALVMTFLFREGSWKEKATFILDATKTHAKNLAKFVTLYKGCMLLLRLLRGGKEASGDAFMAGLVGGYLVFGTNNPINQQIVLYVFARVVIGLVKLPVEREWIKEPGQAFALFAAVSWGLVMWLFRHERKVLQPSLQASMQYLYLDSNHWTDWRTLLWHNR